MPIILSGFPSYFLTFCREVTLSQGVCLPALETGKGEVRQGRQALRYGVCWILGTGTGTGSLPAYLETRLRSNKTQTWMQVIEEDGWSEVLQFENMRAMDDGRVSGMRGGIRGKGEE